MKRKSFFHHSTKSESAKHIPEPEIKTLIKGPSEDWLRKQIGEAGSFSEVWEQHKEQIVHQTPSDYLTRLLKEKKLKRSEIVVRTGLDKAYVYQIFAGKRNPSRDKLIMIAFGMKLSEDETQRILHLSSYRELWPKDERDALFLFAIQHGKSLEDVHAELEHYGLDPLAAPVE